MSSPDISGRTSPAGKARSERGERRRVGWRSLRSKFFASGIILLMAVLTILMLFLPFLNYELDQQIDQQETFNQENIQLQESFNKENVELEAQTIGRLMVFELSRIKELRDVKYYAQEEQHALMGALIANISLLLSLDYGWVEEYYVLHSILNEPDVASSTRNAIRTSLWEKVTFNTIIRDIELLDDSHLVRLTPFRTDAQEQAITTGAGPAINDYIEITAPEYMADEINDVYYVFMPLYIDGSRWGVVKIVVSTEEIRRQLGQQVAEQNLQLQRQAAEQDRFRWLTGVFFIGTMALGCIVGVLVLSLLARRITEPLKLLARNAEVFAEGGDVSRLEKIDTDKDEVGLLAQSFSSMAGDINRLLREKDEAFAALKASQEQLRQSEKLASLGQLSGGIAHEINNALSPIRLRSEEVLITLDAGGDAERDDLHVILKGIEQCSAIVAKLRDFAAPQLGERSLIDLNTVIEETVELVRRQIEKRNIKIKTQYSKLPGVLASGVELEQVFMNLLLNAKDAIEARGSGGGVISISTSVGDGAVTAAITDDGIGMDDEIRSKIFEPFFSTKPVGEGTGLGMSVSFGILQSHGAGINIKSTPGEGTTVYVRFPLPPEAHASEVQGAQ